MSRTVLSLLIAAALTGGTALVSAAPVATAVLQAAPDTAGFSLSGSLEAVRQSTVGAQVGGNVLALLVQAGDRVKAGQPLVQIDARDTQAGLASAEAGVAQADAQAQNAQSQLQRTRELRQQGFISQAALDVAESQARAARAALDQARAGRAQASLARGFATVIAPFDGTVLATLAQAGDLATAGKPLLTLYAPGRLRAVVQVPSSRSALARAATTLQILLPDGRWVTPANRTELPTADAVSQTVEWRLELPADLSATLSPGQAVQVRFAGAKAATGSRPLLPTSAVLQRGELSAVYAVQDGRFVLKPVRLGAAQGNAGIEVLAGLKPGERFAVDAVQAGLAGATPAP
jgi:RND family efflux transporter MFP subunit